MKNAPVTPPLHVLNVDDVDMARYAKTRHLELAGFRVSEAATGEAALALARATLPDIIVLDTRLPDIDGFEVCRLLKADTATAPILILQTSALYVLSSDRLRALNGGADNYLIEPAAPLELVASVRALGRVAVVERTLREADGRKNDFLATLAHELRNPLAPIRNAVEMLQRGGHAAHSPEARAVDAVVRQTKRLTGLVDDLMDVARIEERKLTIAPGPVQVRALIEAVHATCAAGVAAAGHTLEVTDTHPELWIAGDQPRLVRILCALLDNAAKYTDPGGHITLRCASDEGAVRIQVGDNGIGIAEESIEAIFGLFVQAGHRAARVQDGLGIGLALARAVLDEHQGSITAYSAGVGQGSIFEVRLPLVAAPGACVAVPCAEARALQILLVDDNDDATTMLGALLEMHGMAVRGAASGAQALALLRERRPDIAILDIGLPDMTGHELATRVRAAAGAGLPVIALSGDARQDAATGHVFDRLVNKPARIEDLVAMIRELTARRRPNA